jgi:tRNA pseudouridine38-40 synthase
MRYFLHLSYNGSGYFGWQIQQNQPTIEAEIELAMSLLLSQEIDLVGCGRTDTSVNARNFYAHFDYLEMSLEEMAELKRRLNAFLSHKIRILNVYKMAKIDANARFDALNRTYKYYVSTEKQPFNSEFSLYFPHRLCLEKMNEAARILLKHQDFTSFSKSKTQTKTNLCQIEKAQWTLEKDLYVLEITANRFLRNMVRAIVGTLLSVGNEKISVSDFSKIIQQKDRKFAGTSVKGSALFLENVTYPKDFFYHS